MTAACYFPGNELSEVLGVCGPPSLPAPIPRHHVLTVGEGRQVGGQRRAQFDRNIRDRKMTSGFVSFVCFVVPSSLRAFCPYCTSHSTRGSPRGPKTRCVNPYVSTTYITSQQTAPRPKNRRAVQLVRSRRRVDRPHRLERRLQGASRDEGLLERRVLLQRRKDRVRIERLWVDAVIDRLGNEVNRRFRRERRPASRPGHRSTPDRGIVRPTRDQFPGPDGRGRTPRAVLLDPQGRVARIRHKIVVRGLQAVGRLGSP